VKDVNSTLQQKIFELLRPAISYPLYYKYLPAFVKENAYVTISIITNTDASTMQSSDTDTSVLIGIYSRESQANPGQIVNDIAAAVYAVLYPSPQTKIDLMPDFQNCSVSLVNDIVPDAIAGNNFIFINRFLTFRFNIYHR
jgi:hypothetical protein